MFNKEEAIYFIISFSTSLTYEFNILISKFDIKFMDDEVKD